MDGVSMALVIIICLVGVVLYYWLSLRLKAGRKVSMRPLPGLRTLDGQIGQAVETGRGIHFAFGRASLTGSASSTSLAAWSALDYLAKSSCPNGVPPVVTAGDGTLLPAGQDSLRAAYRNADKLRQYSPDMVQFIAWDASPMTYGAGLTDLVNRGNLGSNIMMGRIGSELGLVAEAAAREEMEQIIGSDDPSGLGAAAVFTDKLLIGEELFAAGAYLQGEPAQIAGLQLHDIFRLAAIGGIVVTAIVSLIVG